MDAKGKSRAWEAKSYRSSFAFQGCTVCACVPAFVTDAGALVVAAAAAHFVAFRPHVRARRAPTAVENSHPRHCRLAGSRTQVLPAARVCQR